MLERLYKKSKIWFAVLWIIAYCVIMSIGDALSEAVGSQKSITLPFALLLSFVLLVFLKKNGLFSEYGLCRAKCSARIMLYYVPALILISANLWFGISLNYGAIETVLYVLTMLLVGFLEELIFRGLLFGAMRGDTPRAAIAVSSLTFGIGHIINLFNGSGAELIPNLLQVIYATAAGFMFVMIYLKTKSLIGCIGIHGIFNALSAFSAEAGVTLGWQIFSSALITVITGTYAVYIALVLRREQVQ